MALHLSRAITDGIRRVSTITGGLVFLLLLLSQGALVLSINSLVATRLPPDVADELGIGLTVPLPTNAAIALLVGTILGSTIIFVVLARGLARPRADLSSVPANLFTRRIVRATISLFIAGTVSFIAITIGLAFFLLPGLFLAACFLFVMFTVAVEDRGPVDALRRSWGLSRGNRFRLVVIVLLMGIGGAIVGAVPVLLDAAGAPVVGDLASVLINGVLYVFLYGIMAAAYLQVATDE